MIKTLKTPMKRIGIDARFYGPLGKGLGRYTQEIVDNIIKIDRFNHYVIFLNNANFDELAIAPEDRSRIIKIKVGVRWYTLAEQLVMPWLIWRQHLDFMHFLHFNVPLGCPVKFIVTIHDLILIKYPTVRASTLAPWFYWLKHLLYRLVIWSAVHRARKIIAVSKFTKKDIVNTFHINHQKVVVTYEGVANLARGSDSLFVTKLNDKQTLLGYNIDKPFLLYVGNAYPHKNLLTLIRVFKNLLPSQPDLKLVLVGKADYFYQQLKASAQELGLWQGEHQTTNAVVFPGYVPDQELEVLYQQAVAYVFPSLYEGFGLPPLEAAAKGCPVVSSNRSSLPEVLGKAALYFDPEDETALHSALQEIISNSALRHKLIALGQERVKKFDWWECARQTHEIYLSL